VASAAIQKERPGDSDQLLPGRPRRVLHLPRGAAAQARGRARQGRPPAATSPRRELAAGRVDAEGRTRSSVGVPCSPFTPPGWHVHCRL